MVNEWRAHNDQVNGIARIKKPQGFITSSLDKHVKVWSREGVLWGDLVICGVNPVVLWNFECDLMGYKDTKEVIEVMKVIEPGVDYNKSEIKYEVVKYKDKTETYKKDHWDELIQKKINKRQSVNVEQESIKQIKLVKPIVILISNIEI